MLLSKGSVLEPGPSAAAWNAMDRAERLRSALAFAAARTDAPRGIEPGDRLLSRVMDSVLGWEPERWYPQMALPCLPLVDEILDPAGPSQARTGLAGKLLTSHDGLPAGLRSWGLAILTNLGMAELATN